MSKRRDGYNRQLAKKEVRQRVADLHAWWADMKDEYWEHLDNLDGWYDLLFGLETPAAASFAGSINPYRMLEKLPRP